MQKKLTFVLEANKTGLKKISLSSYFYYSKYFCPIKVNLYFIHVFKTTNSLNILSILKTVFKTLTKNFMFGINKLPIEKKNRWIELYFNIIKRLIINN